MSSRVITFFLKRIEKVRTSCKEAIEEIGDLDYLKRFFKNKEYTSQLKHNKARRISERVVTLDEDIGGVHAILNEEKKEVERILNYLLHLEELCRRTHKAIKEYDAALKNLDQNPERVYIRENYFEQFSDFFKFFWEI